MTEAYDDAYNTWLQASTPEERKAALARRYAALPTLTGDSLTNSQELTALLKREGLGLAKTLYVATADASSVKPVNAKRGKPNVKRRNNDGQLQLGI